ncbi:hypothetical protein F5X99DRAFT_131774 [Biscogniauxia marginata]|nr:hypothetical protein F5X99DRAFT_131774 [Biscogniauxia marginata]
MSKPHVLIVGAGLGGLTLAQSLRKQGISFEIFERDAYETSRTQGWSLAIHTVLDDLQASVPDDMPPFQESVSAMHPTPVPDQLVFYLGGERYVLTNPPETTFFVRANRQRLRRWLSTNIDIQWGKFATKIEQGGDKVTLSFQDGSSASGDVLVGADGTNSVVREHVLGKSNKDILQHLPLSTITAESILLTGEAFERQLEVTHSFALADVDHHHGSMLVQGIMSSVPEQQGAKYFWVLLWHDPIAQHTGQNLVDILPREQRLDIAREMTRGLAPRLTHVLRHTRPEHIRPTGWSPRDAVIDALPVSRATLLGDAAHPTSPFRGEGAVNAMRDAINLGRLLAQLQATDADAVHRALAAYQEEMVPRGVKVVTAARSQFSAYGGDGSKVRILGRPLDKLPDEKAEIGPEGVRITRLD